MSQRQDQSVQSLEGQEDQAILGFVGLTSGETAILRRTGEESESSTHRPESSGGVIYTDQTTMPSLDELLKQHRIATVYLEGLREIVPEPSWSDLLRVVLATAIAIGTTVAGGVLLLLALRDELAQPDPFTGFILFVGGIGLIATLLVALRSRSGQA